MYIKLDEITDYSEIFKKISDIFLGESVVAYPSDTIYGMGCIANSKKAIDRIYDIKDRDDRKPMLVLMKNISMLRRYAFLSKGQLELVHKYLQNDTRATTFILKSRGLLDKRLEAENGGIAIRIPHKTSMKRSEKNSSLPKNDFLIKMISKINQPIVSTSLNKSGNAVLHSLENISHIFGDAFDLVIDIGIIKATRSSRIIDIRDPKKIRIIRK